MEGQLASYLDNVTRSVFTVCALPRISYIVCCNPWNVPPHDLSICLASATLRENSDKERLSNDLVCDVLMVGFHTSQYVRLQRQKHVDLSHPVPMCGRTFRGPFWRNTSKRTLRHTRKTMQNVSG
jgi:hypothetical protein